MLRCTDGSIYTGITSDLERRMGEHFGKRKDAAKYTKSHQAKKLEIAWSSETRSLASKLEFRLKKLSKSDKELLIQNPANLEKFLGDKLDCKEYKVIV
jgi:putative endonuclease